jgi:hypothetical protein
VNDESEEATTSGIIRSDSEMPKLMVDDYMDTENVEYNLNDVFGELN